jgi:hypothetical protein
MNLSLADFIVGTGNMPSGGAALADFSGTGPQPA